jgi:transglutaminase-like putative cysteine protease
VLPAVRVTFFRPVPRWLSRVASALIVAAWLVQMGLLLNRSYLQASSLNLAADLSRYGSSAQWKGVYYRGEKIGFMVGQTMPTPDGFELQEDGQLQMAMLGATSAARIHTSARVDPAFALRSFTFSLDPGTGAVVVKGTLDGRRLDLTVETPAGTRTESRELAEPPALSLNLSRRLAAEGLATGQHRELAVFDPATLRNAPMTLDVEARELVRAAGRPVPAFKVRMRFGGLVSTSWITDVGEVVREESPMGLIVVKETRNRATALAVPGDVQTDMLEAAAIVPQGPRIDDPATVQRLRVRIEGVEIDGPDLDGAGQTASGNVIEVRDSSTLAPGPRDPDAASYLAPEPFLESDAPEVRDEAVKAVQGVEGTRARAERLVRYVNALLEKKPTVSLPSAREVLRTKVGDCNEHTALYVAMARSLGIPARIAVGLVHLHGAFYYHAWPEAYIEERGRGAWIPVDPTLNQFPADVTHLRLARGGLDRQAAILPMIGRARMRILDLQVAPGSTPVLVGRTASDMKPMDIPLPRRDSRGRGCWSRPPR